MSYPVIDYLPFDYERYLHEIVPLWERALTGEVQPLRQQIQAATHFSLWPHINCPPMIEVEMMERLFHHAKGRLWRLFSEYRPETASVVFWDLLQPMLDALQEGTDPSDHPWLSLLHSSLFYTFCCDLPPEEGEAWHTFYSGRMTNPWGGTIVLGHEDIPLWQDYIKRDDETRGLWNPFTSPSPSELIGSLLFPDQYSPDWVAHEPRSVFKYRLGAGFHGFLTSEETVQVLTRYRRQEAPLLATIRDGCLRDVASDELPLDIGQFHLKRDETSLFDMRPEKATGIWTIDWYYALSSHPQEKTVAELEQQVTDELWKAYPEQMKTYQQRYYESLWSVEEVVMRRVELAASRGWGVMMMQSTF